MIVRPAIAAAALLLLGGCTNGGVPTTSGAGGGVTIDVNLTLSQPVSTPYGQSGAYTPPVTTVAVGTQIHFTNTDSFAHTATLISGNPATFPSSSPFKITAQQQSGTNLSGGFSSGVLQAGTSSQEITADRAGTYLFGCFFHYGAPMRGAIVAQ